ncbi:hypothetical protein AXG93_369s1270 [Marchantia polymorpha subsp. ruderalis]|uniref:Cytochrome b5 heme-binding domain-containing protein n=1 Tax=Marchantia polymorpha subsp. ruderalis TaxID=1480154 RepID=A0A176VTU0_MARPO|nr:hypothetical protein AXG93_369s1270 [Marchantia polymorpha subsp. ruderalis]
MAPPSMASMPLMGITPQVSNESVIRSFGPEQKRSSVTAPIGLATSVKATTPTEPLLIPEAVEKKVFSYEEIAKHRSVDDAWIVVDGQVYDVTYFLETHPGGQELILDHLHVRDAGNLMRGKEEEDGHSHSKAAFKMLQQFSIGSVENHRGLQTEENMKKSNSDTKKYTVDLSKPIVGQVGYLGADYDEWVHDPIVSRESPRFFESDISEIGRAGAPNIEQSSLSEATPGDNLRRLP